MSLKQTSAAAQTLYEGVDIKGEGTVALITYIRTDSTRVSPDAQKAAREFIAKKDTIVAIVAIGYADGLFRNITKKGYVLINNKFWRKIQQCRNWSVWYAAA